MNICHTELNVCSLGKCCSIFFYYYYYSDLFSFCENRDLNPKKIEKLPVLACVCFYEVCSSSLYNHGFPDPCQLDVFIVCRVKSFEKSTTLVRTAAGRLKTESHSQRISIRVKPYYRLSRARVVISFSTSDSCVLYTNQVKANSSRRCDFRFSPTYQFCTPDIVHR